MAGLTPGQMAGIVVGGTAVAGLGTAAAVLAAKDQEFYADYGDKDDDALDDGSHTSTVYGKMRGYPNYKKECRIFKGTMRVYLGL